MESYNFCLFAVGTFTYHNVFKDCPCCRMCHNLIPFWGWIVFSYMCICHFVYAFIIDGTLPSSLVYYEYCCCERGCLVPVWVPAFNSLGYIPTVELLSDTVILFNIFRSHHTVSHSSYTVWHSHQQCARVPISLHFCQHLLNSVFLK